MPKQFVYYVPNKDLYICIAHTVVLFQHATYYQRTTTAVKRASDFMVYAIPNLVSTDILNATFNQVLTQT
jgi:hypothetical protein